MRTYCSDLQKELCILQTARIRALLLNQQHKEPAGKPARDDLQIPEHCHNWIFFFPAEHLMEFFSTKSGFYIYKYYILYIIYYKLHFM